MVAFTLVELQVAMAIILLVIAGVIGSHLFGLRMEQITGTKLNASDAARKTLNSIVGDIRSAKVVQIGTGNADTFTPVANGVVQQGSAVRIYPSASLSSKIIYYFDSATSTLKRSTNNVASAKVVAEFITNSVVFSSENYAGTTLTADQNNRVIKVNLAFYQLPYPQAVAVGQGQYFDSYQLTAKITPRCPD